MKRIVARVSPVFMAAVLALTVAAPSVAYNNANAENILMRRVDPVQCGTHIRLKAKVVNRRGYGVRNAIVKFRLRGTWPPGRIGPSPAKWRERAATNNRGVARSSATYGRSLPWVKFWCGSKAGYRTIRTRVPNSGARGKLTIYCGPKQGCTG